VGRGGEDKALTDAAQRGVSVQIITVGSHADSETVRRASRARWGDLLVTGIEIHEYLPTMYHCKVMIADGSDDAVIKNLRKAATDAGATVKIVVPKVGGAKLADGSMLAADGQLAGTPSVLFDAVAVILSDEGAQALSRESAAIDFVRDAFGHLKAIAVDKGGRALLKTANVGQDAGVVDANDKDAFIAAAKTRQWDREKSVRTLA
jgi:phosphatidylserine/phosphatidylglycerophosphate/cardiolipin synthase-like enzyme